MDTDECLIDSSAKCEIYGGGRSHWGLRNLLKARQLQNGKEQPHATPKSNGLLLLQPALPDWMKRSQGSHLGEG